MYALVIISPSKRGALDKSATVSAYLNSLKVEHDIVDADKFINEIGANFKNLPTAAQSGEIDLAITIGGDGTIIRAAHLLQGFSVPILGINLGNLGFLANNEDDNTIELISRYFAGELISEERTNLCVDVVCKGEIDYIENEAAPERLPFFALNEASITRGDTGVMIDLNLDISGAEIGRFRGDGMIVASATGSTAYSLAAGGPIVSPSFRGLIVQPLASHTISARTVLTAENDVVKINVNETDNAGRKSCLYVDGMKATLPSDIKCIYVRRGKVPTTLLYSEHNLMLKKATETFFRGL